MLREVFTTNLETKAMAAMIAVALWFYALKEHAGEWSGLVPVRVKTSDDVAILNQSAEDLYVSFTGPDRLMRQLKQNYQSGKLAALCRITVGPDAEVTEQKSRIRFKDAQDFEGVPEGVGVKSTPSPSEVEVTVMKLTERLLPVKLKTTGELPTGYEVVPNSEAIFPAEVPVKGPKTALDAATYIYTEPFPISEWPTGEDRVNINSTIGLEQCVRIRTPDGEKAQRVTCKETVRFWIDLVKKRTEVSIGKVPIKILQAPNFPYLAKLVEERAEIKLRGPKTVISKLNNTNVVPYVDVMGLQPANVPHSLTVNCDILLPEARGKVEVTVEPPKVGVDVLAREKPPEPKPEPPPKKPQ